jgi:hypothetical protein
MIGEGVQCEQEMLKGLSGSVQKTEALLVMHGCYGNSSQLKRPLLWNFRNKMSEKIIKDIFIMDR